MVARRSRSPARKDLDELNKELWDAIQGASFAKQPSAHDLKKALTLAEEKLKAGANVNAARNPENGGTPLIYAAGWSYVHNRMVQLLLDNGAAVDLADDTGQTPLLVSCNEKRAEVVQLLLDKGAAVDLADEDGRTPLHAACFRNEPSWDELSQDSRAIAQLLLDKGATVDLADENGWTPLINAAVYRFPEVAQLLLDKGAAVDLADTDGRTPLMHAARVGSPEVAQLLLAANADLCKQWYKPGVTGTGNEDEWWQAPAGSTALDMAKFERARVASSPEHDDCIALFTATIEKGAANKAAAKNDKLVKLALTLAVLVAATAMITTALLQ